MSSTTSNQSPSLALFGGTSGTGLSFLTQFLAAPTSGSINVLARTPAKIGDLQAAHGNKLQVVQGDIRSLEALKRCLIRDGRLVDIVVSSIGMTMKMSGLTWVGNDPTICHDGTSAILTAIEELEADDSVRKPASGNKTKIVVLSTTGITEKVRDIPIAMIPLYHWLLRDPHKDKKMMERVVEASGREFVAVRPSFLIEGKRPKGLKAVRTSTEVDHTPRDVAVGYAIVREDVACWILHECVLDGEKWKRWVGKKVTVTY